MAPADKSLDDETLSEDMNFYMRTALLLEAEIDARMEAGTPLIQLEAELKWADGYRKEACDCAAELLLREAKRKMH